MNRDDEELDGAGVPDALDASSVPAQPVDPAAVASTAIAAARAIGPGELHAAACGLFAAGGALDDLIRLIGEEALTDQNAAAELWRACATQLGDPDMAFEPLLMNLDATVAERGDALAQWCASFLAGYTRLRAPRSLEEKPREIVSDLAAIAAADMDLGDDEDNERDFHELFEFARVAVMLLAAEVEAPAAGPAVVH
ncbi:MAG: UPF0149 family protein [Pseudomonadota bacterium]